MHVAHTASMLMPSMALKPQAHKCTDVSQVIFQPHSWMFVCM